MTVVYYFLHSVINNFVNKNQRYITATIKSDSNNSFISMTTSIFGEFADEEYS